MEPNKPGHVIRAFLISIAIWSALSLLTGWNYIVYDRQANIHSTLAQMMALAEARGFTYALLTPPIFYLVGRAVLRGLKPARYLLPYLIGVAPFLALFASIRWLILPPWNETMQRFMTRASSSPLALIRADFDDMISMYISILLAAHAYAYIERVRKQDLERAEYQQALAASELQALRMQLCPHFIFNTLHGVSTLIDSDREKAKATIVGLSSLLRQSLDHGDSDLICLQEELKFVDGYLELEMMRFGDRLKITRVIEPDTLQILVPQFILQLLVENSVRHGVASSREKSWIDIASRLRAGKIELEVRNSVGAKRPQGTGVGLKNTRARLKHLYCDEASLFFRIADDRTATARLVFPALGTSEGAGHIPNSAHVTKHEA